MKIKWIFYKLILRTFQLLPLKKKTVLFSAYQGHSYSCNPRYISEALRNRDSSIDIAWIADENVKLPKNVRRVNYKGLSTLYELATAKVWVDNCRKSIWVRKRKGQFYIQTWHAGISNKKGEAFAIDTLPRNYIISAKNDSQMANLFLSDSRWLTKSYRESFWYNGKVLEKGLPREDKLYLDHNEFHKKVCAFYNIPDDSELILYAPTFRDSGNLSCYNIDYNRIIGFLRKKTRKDWKFIIRLHPNIQNQKSLILYNESILNGSDYDDINDLILASSFFISDYSSCIFDAAIAEIPSIIYASDIDEYSKNERHFAFRWEDLPFLIAQNNDELIYAISHFSTEKYREAIKLFHTKCGFYKNKHASDTVARYIEEIIYGKTHLTKK